jgi:hypothetical protein
MGAKVAIFLARITRITRIFNSVVLLNVAKYLDKSIANSKIVHIFAISK